VSALLNRIVMKICKSRLAVIAAILLVLYTVIGFFLLPFLVERYLPGALSKRLNSQVTLQQVKINPFALSLEARGFQIKEPSGSAIVGFQRLYVNFQLSSLFRWAFTFAEVTVDGISVNVVIEPDGKLNLARLAAQDTTAPAATVPAKDKNGLVRMLLRNFAINQGKIDVTDKRQTAPATVSFYPLNIRLAGLSTLPNREGPYTLTATSMDGMTLQWSGEVSLQPVRSEGSLKFEQLPLATPWKFFRSSLNIAPPEGRLSLDTRYLLDLSNNTTVVTLDDLRVRLTGLGLQLEGAEKAFLNLPEVTLGAGKLDVIQHKIDAVRLAIKGGRVDLIMDKDGVLNMQRIMTPSPGPTPASAPASGGNQAPWAINVSGVKLEGLAVDYSDQTNTPPFSFSTKEIQLAFKAAITTDSPEMQVKVDDLGLTLKQIALGFVDATQPALQVGNLTVAGGVIDLGARSASILRIDLSDGMVDVIRSKDNTINLAQFGSAKTSDEATNKEPQKKISASWRYLLETFSLSGFKTSITDMTMNPDKPMIDLEDIALTVSHFDGKSAFPFEAGLHVVQGGDLKASGNLDPSGIAMKSTITVKDLSLPIAQPYLALQTTDLTLESGLFSTRGTFNRAANGGMTYKGQVGIAKMRIMENSTKETLLGWEQLKTSDLRLGVNPNGLEIDNLKLTGLEGKLIISEDKKINVVEAFKSESQTQAEPQPKEAVPQASQQAAGGSFPVRIKRLSMDNGKLDFADFSLRPQFATKIHELKGVIIGISSTPGARTQVELDGRVDEYGTSRITGEINSFDPKQFTDISMVFRNLEMTNMTPYSGKFAGRKIDSGRLSLDLQYKVQNSQLLGNNKIVIETLKLGEKVDSPDAIHLPLDLAIAILKDSNGVIDIGLPVSGNLDDPEFRYGPIIWKALVNLLTKLVTAPFRALGALFGSGEELLDSVTFDPGSEVIPPPEQEKLIKLMDALRQRPQLKLTITGRFSSDTDGQAIKELQVRRALAEASGMTLEPGENPGPVDFSNPDSQQKLAAMYINRYGQEAHDALVAQIAPKENPADAKKVKSKKSKAKGAEGKQAVEDPGELAKLLYADLLKREQVDPSVLNKLADDRAQAIIKHLTKPDGLAPERVSGKPSESVKRGETVSTVFGLDAM
jgi:hypothetical protein